MKKVIVLSFIATMLYAATAQAEITAIYPKKVCEKTSLGKSKSGGDPLRNKTVVWGAVGLGWCERRSGKHQGDVVGFTGPLTNIGVTGWGKRNGWVYEGMSKTVVKCVDPHAGYCTYLRVKIWHEFDKEALEISIGHHTMKFSLLVGNGLENWR